MFDTEKYSRADSTETDYRKRAHHMLERFAHETGMDWDIHPQELLQWLQGRRDESSPAYWRRTRAALAFFFSEISQASLSDAIKAIGTDGCSAPRFTSANKKKSVSDEELIALTNYLLAPGGSEISAEAHNFFVSCLLTGMRPSEWGQCDLKILGEPDNNSVDGLEIVVQNAKASNGRSHGPSRTLRFKTLSEQERGGLIHHWRLAKQHADDGTFPDFQRRCSDKIRYAASKLWPNKRKRISLYSTRHQSMANGKASGLPKNVIAAMHGHATDRTASEHYGRKQFGKAGRVYAEVPEEEVARVREVPKDWNPPQRGPENSPGSKRQ